MRRTWWPAFWRVKAVAIPNRNVIIIQRRMFKHTWNAATDNDELQGDRCSLAGHDISCKKTRKIPGRKGSLMWVGCMSKWYSQWNIDILITVPPSTVKSTGNDTYALMDCRVREHSHENGPVIILSLNKVWPTERQFAFLSATVKIRQRIIIFEYSQSNFSSKIPSSTPPKASMWELYPFRLSRSLNLD